MRCKLSEVTLKAVLVLFALDYAITRYGVNVASYSSQHSCIRFNLGLVFRKFFFEMPA